MSYTHKREGETMKITTKYLGDLTIEKESIIEFSQGLPGFIEEKQFVLLPMEGTPFCILQSVATPAIAFILSDPFVHFPTYEFKLDDEVKDRLKIKEATDVEVFVILTVADPFAQSTANLKAPVVINSKTKLGKQIILNDPQYETKHHLVAQQIPVSAKGE